MLVSTDGSAHVSVMGRVNADIAGSVVAQVSNFPTNQNVSGSVVAFVNGTVPVNAAGSVVAFQGTDPWIITGSVQGTLSAGATSGSSVVQQGTWRTSVISSTPSSMLVGASVYGNVGLNSTNASVITVGGTGIASVVAFQSDPADLNVAASVVGHAPVVVVGGSVATATTNSSVMLLRSTNNHRIVTGKRDY